MSYETKIFLNVAVDTFIFHVEFIFNNIEIVKENFEKYWKIMKF